MCTKLGNKAEKGERSALGWEGWSFLVEWLIKKVMEEPMESGLSMVRMTSV